MKKFKGNNNNDLPTAMKIAAKTKELDNIKIIPTSDPIPIRKIFRFIKIGNWEKRAINRSSKYMGNDIKNSINNGYRILKPYIIAELFYKGPFIYLAMHYKFE